MIFSSYTYIAFLMFAFVLHWSLPERGRKLFLVIASFIFYASWKLEFTGLLLGVMVFNWIWARWILRPDAGGGRLWLGIGANLATLLYFKYAGFLMASSSALVRLLGCDWSPAVPNILLPLGISFFTFQAIAYLVDVASGEQPVTRLLDYMVFKGFWPQLIAGPIVRLGEIRDQIEGRRHLDYESYSAGGRRILSGLFKKVVLADTLGPIADMVFLPGAALHAVDAATGVLAFGLQIYFDFSAYSDIAVGSARLFGFRFPENFDWPYVSASPQEFWNRWHMSLSRWIRDYVFTPMSFAMRQRPGLAPVWLLVAMALCGLWHGAAWTFVAWGVWHGLLLAANRTILKSVLPAGDGKAPVSRWRSWPFIVLTSCAVHVGWILFRSHTLQQAWSIVCCLATLQGGLRPSVLRENNVLVVASIFAGLLAIQSLRGTLGRIEWNSGWAAPALRILKPFAYAGAIILIIVFARDARTFVYFQF